MAVSRVDTHSKRPSQSSQPAATLRSAPCAAQNRRTARTLEPPPTDTRIGNPCSQSCYRFWRPKVFSNGAFFFVRREVFRWNLSQLIERGGYSLHLCESQRYWSKLGETESQRIASSHSQSRGAISCCRKSQRVAASFSGLHALAMTEPACTGQDVGL